MNLDKYTYKIEVDLEPNKYSAQDKPYFWVIWEIDRNNPESKTNAACGWSASPSAAFSAACRRYHRNTEGRLVDKTGIMQVYQIVYKLKDGTTYHGHVFEMDNDAIEYALHIDFVSVAGQMKEVESFILEMKTFIPRKEN